MLSPNSIRIKRAARNLSTCSIDSGYGSSLRGDVKLSSFSDSRDTAHESFTVHRSHSRSVGHGISIPMRSEGGDIIVVKKEEHTSAPSTPRLTICTAFSNPSSPDSVSPASPCEVRRSHARKSTSKLPSHAVRHLNAWLDTNRHHPYPNAEAKRALAQVCSITIKQVTTWFTNVRQRQLKSQEDDPENAGNANGQTSLQASRKGKKKDYSRSNGASPIDGFLSPPRLSPSASMSEHSSSEGDNWQCTFCGKSLTAKSWRRHEETQHHPKHQWVCLAGGPNIQLPSSPTSICAFCELQNPDNDHFQSHHRIGDCSCKPQHERTFGRPDHLQQHARNFHKCEQPLSDLVREAWRRDGPGMIDDMEWTCGFCQQVLSTWDARAAHIAGHFKAGLTMAHWSADRVAQSTTSTQHIMPGGGHLDALANMGVTLAGPSNPLPNFPNFGHSQPLQHLQHLQPQPSSTTAITPVTSSFPDLDFDPFGFYGNPIDVPDPSLSTSTSYYPAVSNTPAVSHIPGVSPVDYSVMDFDGFGDSAYDISGMHSW